MPGRTPPAVSRTPWLVAGVLCVLAIATVTYMAGKRDAPAPPAMANAGNQGPSDAPT